MRECHDEGIDEHEYETCKLKKYNEFIRFFAT